MKRPILVSLFAMVAAMLTVPALSRAQTAAPGAPAVAAPPSAVRVIEAPNSNEPLVSMDFNETPLADVIKSFRDATGANIISSGTNLQATVSIRLDKVPWRKGLSSILDPQGLQLSEQPVGSGIYVVTAKTVEIPKQTQTFALEFAKASDVTNLLTKTFGPGCSAAAFAPANVVIVTATEPQLGVCEKIIKAIDRPRAQVYIEARFVELSASASKKLGMKWNSLSEWGVTMDSVKAGAEINYGKLMQLETGSTTVRNGSTIVPGSDGAATSYKPSYYSETVKDVAVADKIYAADNAGRSANDMSWKQASGIGGQLTADKFRLAMSAFESMDGVSVFSNPKIIVANEETALVDMTTKEPNVSVKSTRSGTAGDQLDVTADLAKIPGEKEPFVNEAFYSYGISLKVVPRVSPSGQITVQIEPSISDKIGTYSIAGLQEGTPVASYPIIDMRRIQTVFSMQSGTTAVIGGLTKTTEDNTDSGIPGLRKLPWIGPRLFGWKGREKVQKEIIIFVTVGIADPVALPQDVGLPKNATLSREFISGERKEPGDRTKEELLRLDDSVFPGAEKKAKSKKQKAAEAPAITEREAVEKPAAEQPAAEQPAIEKPKAEPSTTEPLLKNN